MPGFASGAVRTGGVLAIACYAVHAGFHLAHGRPEDLLWACHIGAAAVGVGMAAGSATINGVGVLLLLLGTPLWIIDIAGGGEFMPTSCFTHVGGLGIGFFGVRQLGMPSGAWWKATIGLIALIGVSRLATPANVNVAFAIYPGCEKYFSSHPQYLLTMIGLAAGYFLVFDRLLRLVLALCPATDEPGAAGKRRPPPSPP